MNLLKTIADLLKNTLIGVAILLCAITINGQWIMKYVYWTKQDRILENNTHTAGNNTIKYLFDSYQTYFIELIATNYGTYFTSGLLLHYYYYTLQRDRAHEWKCQPNRWLSNELELDAIKTSVTSLLVGSFFFSAVATYIYNGGYYSNGYQNLNDYSLLYSILQLPILFLVTDYALYWAHRIFHWPILYKMFHKDHHRYHQPTVFATLAVHPFETIVLLAVAVTPIFNPIFPICLPIMHLVSFYHYTMQIISHSGINFKFMWWPPWQAETIFHDDHHQYFHVNFGPNMKVWDQIHGTIRQVDRIYTEKTFWGKGKSIQDASQEEKTEHLLERKSENKEAQPKEYNT